MPRQPFFDSVTIERKNKAVIVSFSRPYLVGSTCPVNGGIREDLAAIFNHQICEPVNHDTPLLRKASRDPETYHQVVCETLGLNPGLSASLSTAANMSNFAIARDSFRDLEVVAIATGGVEGCAGRAGDPASYYENDGEFENLTPGTAPNHGTVNIILLINREITRGALYRAVITATEAKSAVFQELNIYSTVSNQLATGTGTDQIAIACQLGTGKPITSTGKHGKVGELIGKTVQRAIKETLSFQNQLTARSRCSITASLTRFGLDMESVQSGILSYLPDDVADLARNNFTALDRDPITVSAVSCLGHIFDNIRWGVLPETCLTELVNIHCAEIAAAVSGLYDALPEYRRELDTSGESIDSQQIVQKIFQAIATGYKDKWRHLEKSK